jgi:methyl-accepting chemotaxis protein
VAPQPSLTLPARPAVRGAGLRIKTIRARLNLAFGFCAAMTVICALVGLYAFTSIGGTTRAIVSNNFVATVESLRLAEEASSLIAAVPRLMEANDERQRKLVAEGIEGKTASLAQRIDRLRALDNAKSMDIDAPRLNMAQRLAALNAAVAERIALSARRHGQSISIRKAHEDLLDVIVPVLDDVNFELMTRKIASADKTVLANAIESLRRLLEVQAEANLMAGVLTEASLVTEAARLTPLRDITDSARRKIEANLAALRDTDLQKKLNSLYERLSLIAGDNGIIALRAQELTKARDAQLAFAATQDEAVKLKRAVDGLVDNQRVIAETVSSKALDQIRFGQLMLIALSIAALAAGALIAWLYVGRNIARRLGLLSSAMRQLAAGDTKAVIAEDGEDEIADMARTLVVFRQATSEVVSARQGETERARQAEQRRQQIETATREFEAAVSDTVAALENASKTMDSSSRTMAETAGRNRDKAEVAAGASKQATESVVNVAMAAEEMAQSVEHISEQVRQSAAVAREAAGQAKDISTAIGELAASIEQISTVSNLIRDIAAQTNLLALNATIEAARAGDAGRGFAVVAQEVKSLAAQTGRATEDITRQIYTIEETTSRVVVAMQTVASTVARLDEIAHVATAAVQQQRSVTQEIAQSASSAADGTRDVSQNIGDVSEAATETGHVADTVLNAANALSERSRMLNREVERFLTQVRAA